MRMQQELAPGQIVCNPAASDWGLGQVQSVVGARVTVNFEHIGKMTINTAIVTLDVVEPPLSPACP